MPALKFRKRPVVIEAFEWDGSPESAGEVICWVLSAGTRSARFHDATEPDGPSIVIDTLEGAMTASPGDFIIRGVQDEHYPCKPDIFAVTYEPVR